MSMTEKDFGTYNIGSIVTIKSNHLKSSKQFHEILLAGDPNFVTPLMVVSEILKVKSDNIDEDTGAFRNSKGDFQYKCIWFSNKSFKIEEQWLNENELIHIVESNENDKKNDNVSENKKFLYGDNLVLKTNRLELQKRKTYLELEKDKTTNKISSLLTFCSPVFILVGYSSVNQKEPLIDNRTGKQKREYCSKLVKVKSFNVKEDKYSEFLIPIEAVEKVEVIKEENVNYYLHAKNNKKLLTKFSIIDPILIENIFEIKSIFSISNIYMAEIQNVFTNEVQTNEIQNSKFTIIDDLENQIKYPKISKTKTEFKIQNIEDYLKVTLNSNQYIDDYKINQNDIDKFKIKKLIKIVYKNKFEKITTRFCIPIFFFSIKTKIYNQKEAKETSITEHYVQSFCLFRNDYRNFKVDRILSLELINNILLNQYAIKNWSTFVND